MFERSYMFEQQTSAPAAVYTVELNPPSSIDLPESPTELRIQAWTDGSSTFTGDLIIFGDTVPLFEAQARIASSGQVDCLLVASAAPVEVRMPENMQTITVFFPIANSAVAIRFAQVRVYETWKYAGVNPGWRGAGW